MQHSPLIFRVSPSSSEPIYRQLMDQLERLIVGGQLNAGDRLPSVRDVATELEVNPMTVSKAYGLMETTGWLSRQRGKGMVVRADDARPAAPSDAAELLRPAVIELVEQARQAGVKRRELLRLVTKIVKENEP